MMHKQRHYPFLFSFGRGQGGVRRAQAYGCTTTPVEVSDAIMMHYRSLSVETFKQ